MNRTVRHSHVAATLRWYKNNFGALLPLDLRAIVCRQHTKYVVEKKRQQQHPIKSRT